MGKDRSSLVYHHFSPAYVGLPLRSRHPESSRRRRSGPHRASRASFALCVPGEDPTRRRGIPRSVGKGAPAGVTFLEEEARAPGGTWLPWRSSRFNVSTPVFHCLCRSSASAEAA